MGRELVRAFTLALCPKRDTLPPNACCISPQLGYNYLMPTLSDFYSIQPARRDKILLDAIHERHAWHYARNSGYRATVSARDVGANLRPGQLPRLLRVSSITFKGYIKAWTTQPFGR